MDKHKYKYSDIAVRSGDNLTDIDSVAESVNNLLNIMENEVMFNRELGSRIPSLLFNKMTKSNGRLILSEIIYRVSRFDSRVSVDKSSSVTMIPDRRVYEATIYLVVEGVVRTIPLTKLFKSKNEDNYEND